ncbi:MAG: phosphatidylglycerophosphatase A [Pyrinomonadaceae bacterium]|nr:phosphatidylglycerophosphatase A [Pyrinomonadaceae bacterium]
MKKAVEKKEPKGLLDGLSLAISTVGVGYLPLAPGTWGSAVGVAIYIAAALSALGSSRPASMTWALHLLLLGGLCLLGIWAADRSIPLLGNEDPSQVVIDEVMGQLVTFLFVPVTSSWQWILAGFLLFRLFDIWKPYPIDDLQELRGGLGICADDLVAGVYAGICLAAASAVTQVI